MARGSVEELGNLIREQKMDPVSERDEDPNSELRALLNPLGASEEILEALPELASCAGIVQDERHHLDVLDHTLLTARNLEDLRAADFQSFGESGGALARHLSLPGPGGWDRWSLLMLAALLHDCGKPETRSVSRSGRVRFLGHESAGARLAREAALRLQLPKTALWALETLVAQHRVPILLPGRRSRPSELYGLFKAAGDLLPELLLLSVADVGAALGPAQPDYRLEEQSIFVREMLEEYFQGGFLKNPNLPVSSIDLEVELGIVDPKKRDTLLERLLCDYIDGEFQGREDGLVWASELEQAPLELW
jgi:poly(A) polymerase